MPRVHRSAQAHLDLLEIWLYITENGDMAVADRFLDSLQNTCLTLAGSPGMGRLRTELAPDLRSFPVGEYVIFYRPAGEGIDLVRVLHGKRDIDSLLQ